MMHAGVMAKGDDTYLTVWSIAGGLASAAYSRLVCWRRGHDTVLVGAERFCRRCYGTSRV